MHLAKPFLGMVLCAVISVSVHAQPPAAAPPVPDPRIAAEIPMYGGEPALGPLDPGPLPQMPGYFTNRSLRRNYRQTPFFGRNGHFLRVGPAGGYGNYGAHDYYPGVYPYYDAQAHLRWYQAYKRERLLIESNRRLRTEARQLFFDGDYETAAIRFLGAAEQNHGDAASRVHAGHTLFALGQYGHAHAQLRRAFQLQPALVFARFDPRSDYADPADFDGQLKTLRRFVKQHLNDGPAAAVLGYMVFYTQGPTKARPLLERAYDLLPDDSLVNSLLRVAAQASWNDNVDPSQRPPRRPYDAIGVEADQALPYDVIRRAQQAPKARAKKPERLARSTFRRI
ncbi:MAG: hypothetical protein V3T70_00405 [Phycisphaerae bacterium]